MNTITTLLIFNPIESFVILYGIYLFSKIKLNLKIIIHCYILGFILFIPQKLVESFTNSILMMASYIIYIILMALLIYLYFKIILKLNIKIKIIFFISLWIQFSTTIFTFIFTFIFKENIYKFVSISQINEFIIIISLKLFTLGVIIGYEKFFKIFCYEK